MTRTRHDLFAKQHLEALLETLGTVTTSRKVTNETREVDFWLRLMGRGAVQAQAIAELLALPANHPMKRTTMEYLAVLQISLNVGQNLSTDERVLAMNLSPVYEKWRQETLDEGLQQGLEQGLEQGLQRGRQEEGRSLILRQLTRRIGTITPTSEAKILTLSISELETLGEALLDFSSSADLDDWLRTLGP
jgi:hypothetical protein